MITTRWEPHKAFEEETETYFRSLGFLLQPFTYHQNQTEEGRQFQKAIGRTFTLAAMWKRSQADRTAFYPPTGLLFDWDIKTHQPGIKHDGCFEVLPLIFHLHQLYWYGLDCLYVYKDSCETREGERVGESIECGFWVSAIPKIRSVKIPPRYQEDFPDMFDYITHESKRLFPGTWIDPTATTLGTNDPFAIIKEDDMRRLPHWQKIVKDVIGATAASHVI